MDQLPRLGKRELICLLLFTRNYVVSVRKGFLFLWVLGMGYVTLLWHSLSLPYNYFKLKYPLLKLFEITISDHSSGVNTLHCHFVYKNLNSKSFVSRCKLLRYHPGRIILIPTPDFPPFLLYILNAKKNGTR